MEVKELTKDEHGKLNGAVLHDKQTGATFTRRARVIVNCAGIHADFVRRMDDPDAEDRIVGARGTHIMLPRGILPKGQGLLIPDTADGRLVFILPYDEGYTIVGTTDDKCEITHFPKQEEKDVEFLVRETGRLLGKDYDVRGNIKAVWSGIRPLVK